MLRLAGLDEAGRGPLAGPVVAGCVVLPAELPPQLAGLDDSKRLSAARRELLYDHIIETALATGVALACREEIDRINILQATRLAMSRALEQAVTALAPLSPQLVLTDGKVPVATSLPQETLIGGDHRSFNIAAASILAKVSRDRMMRELERQYPGYGFAQHKGYPTAQHRAALRKLGPTPVHRRSFRLL